MYVFYTTQGKQSLSDLGRKLKNLKGYTKKKDKITSQYKAKDSTIRYIFVSKGCYWFVGLNHESFMIDFDKWI